MGNNRRFGGGTRKKKASVDPRFGNKFFRFGL